MLYSNRFRATAFTAALLLFGCGGGGGGTTSPGTNSGTSVSISGVAVKGPLNGAYVKVYAVDQYGNVGGLLASGSTSNDNSGSFSVTIPGYTGGAVLINVYGGNYTSEYDGKTVQSSGSYPMSAALASVPNGGLNNVAVTPLSDMAAMRVGTLVAQGYTAVAALQQADKEVETVFGLNGEPELTQPNFDAGSLAGKSDNSAMALALINLDTFCHRAAPSDPDAVYTGLSADFTDGSLDGSPAPGRGLTVQYGSKSYSSADQLKTDLFHDLVVSTGAYVNNVSPAAAVAWSEANPLQARADGVTADPVTYSCDTTNPLLVFDSSGNAACWDGTMDANGIPLIGLYYICAADGSKVANESSCPPSGVSINATGLSTTIAVHNAPSIQPFVAVDVKPFTAADIQAMQLADSSAALPSWASQSSPLTSDQLYWINQESSLMQAFYSGY